MRKLALLSPVLEPVSDKPAGFDEAVFNPHAAAVAPSKPITPPAHEQPSQTPEITNPSAGAQQPEPEPAVAPTPDAGVSETVEPSGNEPNTTWDDRENHQLAPQENDEVAQLRAELAFLREAITAKAAAPQPEVAPAYNWQDDKEVSEVALETAALKRLGMNPKQYRDFMSFNLSDFNQFPDEAIFRNALQKAGFYDANKVFHAAYDAERIEEIVANGGWEGSAAIERRNLISEQNADYYRVQGEIQNLQQSSERSRNDSLKAVKQVVENLKEVDGCQLAPNHHKEILDAIANGEINVRGIEKMNSEQLTDLVKKAARYKYGEKFIAVASQRAKTAATVALVKDRANANTPNPGGYSIANTQQPVPKNLTAKETIAQFQKDFNPKREWLSPDEIRARISGKK